MSKRYRFLGFFLPLLLLSGSCFAQEISEIRITYLKADEPPTIPSPTPQTIVFQENSAGDFEVAKTLGFSRKEKKQVKASFLKMEDVQLVNNWLLQNKREFSLPELGLSASQINQALEKKPLALTQQVSPNHIIKPDSSSFCIRNAAFLQREYVIGGFDLKIEIVRRNEVKEVFAFNTPSFMSHEIDLVSYFTFAPLMIKSLPASFAEKGLFNKEKMLEGVLYYLRYEECEGYYYSQFLKKHPNRTSAQNRSKEGWDFKEYLKTKE